MRDLIEALLILLKYGNFRYPTGCRDDELFVYVDPAEVSADDKARLEQLGLERWDMSFRSTRFGSR